MSAVLNDTEAPVTVDLSVAKHFLTIMAEGEPVTFQTFDDKGRKPDRVAKVMHGDIDECGQELVALNGRGAGIFWTVNFTDGQGRTRDNVTGIRCVFIDLDGAPLQPLLDAGVEPHAVIESSPSKWHVYWQVTGCSLEQFKPAQQALAAKFGGDPSVNDLPRVLRLPGFIHRKGEPFRTRIVSLEPFQPYQFDDLVQRLRLNLSAPPKPKQRPRVDPDTGEIQDKVRPPGRHDYLVKWAAQLNWRGIPHEGIRVALQAENLRRCEPPKTTAEVDAVLADVLKRYASQHGRDAAQAQFGAEAAAHLIGGSTDAPPDPLAALGQWVVTDEQVETMKATRLIWRDLIAMSHLSVWSAPGNGCKTSAAKFAAGELAANGFTVLFLQEDASAGDLPALHRHAKMHGYRLLNSTLTGSSPDDQIRTLRDLARGGADLSAFVLFFDTLKKYTDLMSKGGARAFFQLMRALTQRGATIVLLGHTNKHRGIDGKLIFEGVGDVRNDVDEMLYIEATDKDLLGLVNFTIRPDKVRCAIREATFALDTKTMIVSALDEVVDVASIVERQRRAKDDGPLIAQVRQTLARGGMNLTDLVERVAKEAETPRGKVRELIERYASEHATCPDALWMETRTRLNNARHISLRPTC